MGTFMLWAHLSTSSDSIPPLASMPSTRLGVARSSIMCTSLPTALRYSGECCRRRTHRVAEGHGEFEGMQRKEWSAREIAKERKREGGREGTGGQSEYQQQVAIPRQK